MTKAGHKPWNAGKPQKKNHPWRVAYYPPVDIREKREKTKELYIKGHPKDYQAYYFKSSGKTKYLPAKFAGFKKSMPRNGE